MRILCIIMSFVLLTMTGCASNQKKTNIETNTEAEAREQQQEILTFVPFFSEEVQIETGVFDFQMDWANSEKEELDPGLQKEINQLCGDICDFFNTELGATWKFEPIKAYRAEVEKNMGSGIDACYYDGKIFIDKHHSEEQLKGEFKFAVAHELVHFLSHTNNGEDARFSLHAYDDCYIGMYLEEAFVDSLARKYMLSRDSEISQEEMADGYIGIRSMVEILQLSVPDVYIYFFNDNIEGLKEEVDSMAESRVDCIGSPFEKWAYLLDLIYKSQDLEELQERLSKVLRFLAVNTPAEKAGDFTSILKKEGINGAEVFAKFMY